MRMSFFVMSALVFLPFRAEAADPLQLIKNVAANYAALSKTTFDFEMVELREFRSASQNQTQKRQRIVGSGGRYREETLPSEVLYLFDGQYNWAYNQDRNEYTKTSSRVTARTAPSLSTYEIAGYRVKSARLLRVETLELATGPVACEVIEVEREPTDDRMQYSPTTYWIDANRNLVLKSRLSYTIRSADGGASPSETTVTISFSRAVVGQPVDESLFRFRPPSDAVLVDRLTFGPKSTLVGTDSPDFQLAGADGKPVSNAALRGNPVLLQFGTGSDEDSMYFLEMTYRSLKSKGLMAIYVLPARNQAGGASEMYSVPMAIDSDGSVARRFGIAYTGTVLIDRIGRIAYVGTNFRNSLDLARALQKTGVW